jgi:hypothetical protein
MTFGSQADGTSVLVLTPDEKNRLVRGEAVVRESGDSEGEFVIRVEFERPGKGRPYHVPGQPRKTGVERLIEIMTVADAADNKDEWSRLGRAVLKDLAARLGFTSHGPDPDKNDHHIEFNPGGVLVSGDLSLSSHWVFLSMAQYDRRRPTFYFRTAGPVRELVGRGKTRRRFNCGGNGVCTHNYERPYTALRNLDALAADVAGIKPRSIDDLSDRYGSADEG